MNTVEPIKDPYIIKEIANALKAKSDRDYIMFILGIYSGLRISDILTIKVCDVKNKEYIYLKEMKTGKEKKFPIYGDLKSALKEYISGKNEFEYLFKSRKGFNKAINRKQAYKILNDVIQKFGIEHIGTHTMRKTFGYHFYKMYPQQIVNLQKIFNHSSPAVTLRYIGIEQEDNDKLIRKLNFNIR